MRIVVKQIIAKPMPCKTHHHATWHGRQFTTMCVRYRLHDFCLARSYLQVPWQEIPDGWPGLWPAYTAQTVKGNGARGLDPNLWTSFLGA